MYICIVNLLINVFPIDPRQVQNYEEVLFYISESRIVLRDF